MSLKIIIMLASIAIITGTSFLTYTPVVATSALGLNEKDLSHEYEYKGFINKRIRLIPDLDNRWQLNKVDGGRYHIEKSVDLSKKKVICDSGDGNVVSIKIFDESVNSGIFNSVKVT